VNKDIFKKMGNSSLPLNIPIFNLINYNLTTKEHSLL